VCYGVQESQGAMDGGRGRCIEDGLAKGTGEARIRGSMRKKKWGRVGVLVGGCCLLTTWLVVEILCRASNLTK